MSQLHIVDHPLITHKLSIMRNKKTGSKDFRELLDEIAMLMGYELTRDLPLETITIETPITKMDAKRISLSIPEKTEHHTRFASHSEKKRHYAPKPCSRRKSMVMREPELRFPTYFAVLLEQHM